MGNFAGLIPRADFADKEPRIRDLELGERLGYASPVDVRKLIRRLREDGKLPGISQIATVANRSDGLPAKPSTEFWLDERSALLVASQSGMPAGIDVTIEVIDTFVRYRRGELATTLHPLFARQRSDWEALWTPKIVQSICALYGNSRLYTSGSTMPGKWLGNVQRKIYRYVWDSNHVDEAIKRSPCPRHGDNWHQHMTPQARTAFAMELERISDIALLCLDHADPRTRFWERMNERYLSMPMQLGFQGMLIASDSERSRAIAAN